VAYLPKPVRAEQLFAAIKAHLGVELIWDADASAADDAAITTLPRHATLAARLREAVEIGAVTDLHALAGSLVGGDEADVALGRKIASLASGFDFDGVRALADSLEAAQAR
jgi:hypothetical protein